MAVRYDDSFEAAMTESGHGIRFCVLRFELLVDRFCAHGRPLLFSRWSWRRVESFIVRHVHSSDDNCATIYCQQRTIQYGGVYGNCLYRRRLSFVREPSYRPYLYNVSNVGATHSRLAYRRCTDRRFFITDTFGLRHQERQKQVIGATRESSIKNANGIFFF